MKKAFLSVKFHEDNRNKKFIEDISNSIQRAGMDLKVIARDYEKWGAVHFEPEELMKLTLELIRKSNLLIVEFSEKGVGLGIEAGYAYANNIPIVILAKKGSDISSTIKGIADKIIFYEDINELTTRLKSFY